MFRRLPSATAARTAGSLIVARAPALAQRLVPLGLAGARPLAALTQTPPPGYKPFELPADFVAEFASRAAPFGFNGLGKLVYERTYARPTPDGGREHWHETVRRVVNGTFNMQKQWLERNELGWDGDLADAQARDMYERIFEMKFLPPGRGLWAMGTPITEERRLFAALNNCAFVSTDKLHEDCAAPFTFLMEAAMLGVGVGFDTLGAGLVHVRGPSASSAPRTYQIPDSREGWVQSLRLIIESYVHGTEPVAFDYALVRPAGSPIRGFGGVASGPGPLRELHESTRASLEANKGKALTVTTIVDVMNLVGRCVVAGNVRRTAEIAFGNPNDPEYVNLKNYEVNPARAAYGWTSNNSVFAELGMNYEHLVERVASNGEPGFAWLDNMRNYGRMNGVRDLSDSRAAGGNPCLEQTLESFELCCLVETFPHKHGDLADFQKTLESAFLYAKTVTLGETQWPQTNRVMLRNRRIGCSISGVAQFIAGRSLGDLRDWCEEGYATLKAADTAVSERFCVPKSVKITSVKPSGSVSLLAGATPGLHYPESRHYIRRMRLPRASPLVGKLRRAGLPLEPAVGDEAQTLVVEFPVDAGEGIRSVHEVSMWEQLSLAAFLQRHWADNQVSCTVTFDPKTEKASLARALDYFQWQLKGISFLPRLESTTAYPQMPYEKIDEEAYLERMRALDLSQLADDPVLGRGLAADGPVSSACAEEWEDAAEARWEGDSPQQQREPSSAASEAGALAVERHVDHTPDVFCDSDRCYHEEVRQIAADVDRVRQQSAASSTASAAAAEGGGSEGSGR